MRNIIDKYKNLELLKHGQIFTPALPAGMTDLAKKRLLNLQAGLFDDSMINNASDFFNATFNEDEAEMNLLGANHVTDLFYINGISSKKAFDDEHPDSRNETADEYNNKLKAFIIMKSLEPGSIVEIGNAYKNDRNVFKPQLSVFIPDVDGLEDNKGNNITGRRRPLEIGAKMMSEKRENWQKKIIDNIQNQISCKDNYGINGYDNIDSLDAKEGSSKRFFGIETSERESALSQQYKSLSENATGIRTIERIDSRNGLCRIFMLYKGANIDDTIANDGFSRNLQLKSGSELTDFLTANCGINNEKGNDNQKLRNIAEMYAMAGKKFLAEKLPEADFGDNEDDRKEFIRKNTAIMQFGINYTQSMEKLKGIPEFRNAFNDYLPGMECEDVFKKITNVSAYVSMYRNRYITETPIDAANAKKSIEKYADLGGSSLLDIGNETSEYEILNVNNQLTQLTQEQALPGIGDEKSHIHEQLMGYLNGSDKFFIPDSVIKSSIGKEMTPEEAQDSAIYKPLNEEYHVSFPKLSDDVKKKMLEISAESDEKVSLSDEDLKLSANVFDEAFKAKGINSDLISDLSGTLENRMFQDKNDKGTMKVENLIYIDGIPAEKYANEHMEGFDGFTGDKRQQAIKAQIISAMASGRVHVDMVSMKLNSDNQYEPKVSEIKAGLDVFNGKEGLFSRNRAKLADKMYKDELPLNKDERFKAIKDDMAQKTYKNRIAVLNEKARIHMKLGELMGNADSASGPDKAENVKDKEQYKKIDDKAKAEKKIQPDMNTTPDNKKKSGIIMKN